ncbi:MAG: hypothetical protein GY745_17930 [Actinomycetia bacterium]|nr:hypothetical protein [Actinomycetes bacterium]MCP3911154.1 hypothetical protein [Actinomycetes bacterium]MCP4086910.1 hypothetical protein [Actinomycetes bacterium]
MTRSALVFAAVLAAVAGLLVACSNSDGPPDPAVLEETFQQFCSESASDPVDDVCDCAWDSMVADLGATRIVEVNRVLIDEPDDPLPDDVLAIVADCVVDSISG